MDQPARTPHDEASAVSEKKRLRSLNERRKIGSLRHGRNARKNLGSEAEARALWRSYKKRPIHPLVIKADGTLVDGYRRSWGAVLEGDLEHEVPCVIFDDDPTPEEITKRQLISSIHRADIPLADKCEAIVELGEGKANKELAEELDLDPSTVTKLLSYRNLIPEARQAVKEGAIGLRKMYEIGLLPAEAQPALLAIGLNATADETAKERRRREKRDDEKAAKTASIKVVLGDLTVSVKGEAVSLDTAIAKLPEAARELERARKAGHDAKTWAALVKKKARVKHQEA